MIYFPKLFLHNEMDGSGKKLYIQTFAVRKGNPYDIFRQPDSLLVSVMSNSDGENGESWEDT